MDGGAGVEAVPNVYLIGNNPPPMTALRLPRSTYLAAVCGTLLFLALLIFVAIPSSPTTVVGHAIPSAGRLGVQSADSLPGISPAAPTPTTTAVVCLPATANPSTSCTGTVTGESGSITGEILGWSQSGGTGSVTFVDAFCFLAGSPESCSVDVTAKTSGGVNIQASYPGDTGGSANAPSSGIGTLVATVTSGSGGSNNLPVWVDYGIIGGGIGGAIVIGGFWVKRRQGRSATLLTGGTVVKMGGQGGEDASDVPASSPGNLGYPGDSTQQQSLHYTINNAQQQSDIWEFNQAVGPTQQPEVITVPEASTPITPDSNTAKRARIEVANTIDETQTRDYNLIAGGAQQPFSSIPAASTQTTPDSDASKIARRRDPKQSDQDTTHD